MVVEGEGGPVGLRVDEVFEVTTFGRDRIEVPPAFVGGGANDALWGIAKQDDRLVILLALDEILRRR